MAVGKRLVDSSDNLVALLLRVMTLSQVPALGQTQQRKQLQLLGIVFSCPSACLFCTVLVHSLPAEPAVFSHMLSNWGC